MEKTDQEHDQELPVYLSGEQLPARWMRMDTAQILKRFFFCERSLLISMAAWLPSIGPLEIKTELPRFIWQNAQTADALRKRIFELRYPSKLMEEGDDVPLIAFCDSVRNAPSAAAFLAAIGSVLLPLLRDAYCNYLKLSDPIADGPTHRFLTLAVAEKEQQIYAISQWAEAEIKRDPSLRKEAQTWTQSVREHLAAIGGIGLDSAPVPVDASPLPTSHSYQIPDAAVRDARFLQCRFYWPDIVDSTFPYGEGIGLQLRAALSHLNEVWAVETGGIILSAFAEELPWEWIVDASRWTYDEARHCRMGLNRLATWGFEPSELPLGTYIYDSVAGQPPLYRLGLLFYFETKNINHKPKRADLFRTYGDTISERDMEFDWADETIHAGYGKYWMGELLKIRGQDPDSYKEIRDSCRDLVDACIARATPDEISGIKEIAESLVQKAYKESQRA